MILEIISILKLSSRSLVNHSHLLDPQSRSFMQADNKIQNLPALDCLAKDDHRMSASFSPAWEELMILHLSYPTPVSVSQSGERGKLSWHEINPGRIWGITTLDSSACVWVCVSVLFCQTWRLTDTQEQKLILKETIPSHLDERHDQRDWVSLRNSYLFFFKNLILSHQIVLVTTRELKMLCCFVWQPYFGPI